MAKTDRSRVAESVAAQLAVAQSQLRQREADVVTLGSCPLPRKPHQPLGTAGLQRTGIQNVDHLVGGALAAETFKQRGDIVELRLRQNRVVGAT